MKANTPVRFQNSSGQFLPVLLVLIGFFVGGFFTYDLGYTMMDKSSVLEDIQHEAAEKRKTLDALGAIKQSADLPENQVDIQKYAGQFREDQILESLFAVSGSGVTIGAVSFQQGERLPSGISLGSVNISVQAENLTRFNSLIDDLTGENAKRRYMIKALSFPYDTNSASPIAATIQLGLYYIK